MIIGYARVSKSDGTQSLDLQMDALINEGIDPKNIYRDHASGRKSTRAGLETCLNALEPGDILVIWKLDRLGRSMRDLVNIVHDLNQKNINFKVLSGQGAQIDTTTSAGKLVFGVFAAMAEFEADLIKERTMAGLAAARARGRNGGRRYMFNKNQVKILQSAVMSQVLTIGELCDQMNMTRTTLYRYVSPSGELRKHGITVMES